MQKHVFEVRKEPHGKPQTVIGTWDDAFEATGCFLSLTHRNAIIAAATVGGPSVDTLYGMAAGSIKLIANVIAEIPEVAA